MDYFSPCVYWLRVRIGCSHCALRIDISVIARSCRLKSFVIWKLIWLYLTLFKLFSQHSMGNTMNINLISKWRSFIWGILQTCMEMRSVSNSMQKGESRSYRPLSSHWLPPQLKINVWKRVIILLWHICEFGPFKQDGQHNVFSPTQYLWMHATFDGQH